MELVEGNRGKRVRSRPNCRISDNERQQRQFHAVDVNRYLEFDSGRYLRLLCRRGFIVAVYSENKRIAGYTRSESAWPPPREFFERGAIGLAYYIQTWFRYYLQQWITDRMDELESKEGVYSLDYQRVRIDCATEDRRSGPARIPVRDGDFVDKQRASLGG